MVRIGGQDVPPKTLLLITSESSLIVLGLLLASSVPLWNADPPWMSDGVMSTFGRFALIVLICELSLYYNDLYDLRVVIQRSELLVRLLQALGIACLVLALLYFLMPWLSVGGGIAVVAAGLILPMILGWRWTLDAIGLFRHRSERVLIVGTGLPGIALAREICSRPELHYQILGFLDEKGRDLGKSLVNPGIVGSVSDLEQIAIDNRVDHIILSLAERRGQTPVRELLHLKFAGIQVDDAHTLYERVSGRILLDHLSPSWLILSEGFRKSALLMAVKRTVDVIISLCVLTVAAPLMALIALAIWLETGRPVIFRQKRVGKDGREFHVLKFRSMHKNAEQEGPRWAADRDHRITRVGRVMRKFRLDELPQLFNVLRGEMSLVGPRPEQPHFCSMLEEKIPFYGLRHTVRPGITGWAQVKYRYGSSIEDAKSKLELDLFYIKHLSALLDLAIIFETFKVVLLSRGAK